MARRRKGKTALQKSVDKEIARLNRMIKRLNKQGFYVIENKKPYSTQYSTKNLQRLKAKQKADIMKYMDWKDPITNVTYDVEEGQQILKMRATQTEMTLDTLHDIIEAVPSISAREDLRTLINEQIDQYGLTPYLESLDENKKEIYENLAQSQHYRDPKRASSYARLTQLLLTKPMTAEMMENMSNYDDGEYYEDLED